MTTHTAVLAEDEAILRGELRDRVTRLWPSLQLVGEAGNGLQALDLIDRHRPDVLFLDIEMPGMNGLEVARRTGGRCHIVFITAFDAHAIAAFEHGALDYLLKPYEDDRLARAIDRVRQRLGGPPAAIDGLLMQLAQGLPRRDHLRWINATVGTDVRLITVEDICYLQAGDGYTHVFTADHESLIRLTLRELVDQLDPACFWTIHRSTIVNANAVAGVTRDLRGRMQVKLKCRSEKLTVSEANERLFRTM